MLFFNELVRLIWGPAGMTLPLPSRNADRGPAPARPVLSDLPPGDHRRPWPSRRCSISLVMRTRLGMLIRAGASNREMVGALGVNIKLLYTLVFGLGAALAGFAGVMQAPILTVQIGMGENILILAFVVIIIGGIGSIRGAFVAAAPGRPDRHHRPGLPARHAASGHEQQRRRHARPGPVIDVDLPADGRLSWCSGRKDCSRRRADERARAHIAQSRVPVARRAAVVLLALRLFRSTRR